MVATLPRWPLATALTLALLPAAPAQPVPVGVPPPLPQAPARGTPAPAAPATPAAPEPDLPPGWVLVKLGDDSVLPVKLLDERIEVEIKYGKLTIPLADVRAIEAGHHVTDEMAKQIEKAVSDLGSPQFRTREEAGKLLVGLREKAYPALKRAAGGSDAEVTRRAEEVMEKIRGLVPEAKLAVPEFDTVTTADNRFTGRILTPQLKARSAALGELTLKLADLAAVTTGPSLDEKELAGALPDPGFLTNFQNQVGKSFVFKVTGALGATIWGTGTYTLDSGLATAAVHAGVLKAGEAGYVKVAILGPSTNFVGSTQHGVASSPFQAYPGAFQILPRRGGR